MLNMHLPRQGQAFNIAVEYRLKLPNRRSIRARGGSNLFRTLKRVTF